MRYPEAHAARSGSVPPALYGKKTSRMLLSAAIAAMVGVAPVLVHSSPAMATAGDLVFDTPTVSGPEDDTVTIDYTYTGAAGRTYVLTPQSAGLGIADKDTDFTFTTPANLSLTLDGGTTPVTGSITINLLKDEVYEGLETFTLTADDNSGDSEVASVSIQDGAAPDLVLTNPNSTTAVQELAEGNNATVTVTAALPTGWTATTDYEVQFSTVQNTASPATDYTAFSNVAKVIKQNVPSVTTDVTIKGDGLKDSLLEEQLTVIATSPGALAQTPIKIKDNADDAKLPVLTIDKAATAQEGGNSEFLVKADHGSDTDITAKWSSVDTTPTTGHGVATADTDFTYEPDAAKRLVTIPATTDLSAKNKEKKIVVALKTDTSYEQAEDFTIGLSDPSGATLGTAKSAMGTILDEEDLTVSVLPTSVDEGNDGKKAVTFTATLSEASTKQVSASWKTDDTGKTAKAGLDYVTSSGWLTFEPGKKTQTFTVDIIGDKLDESDETFSVKVESDFKTLTGLTQEITIKDDDASPSFTFADVTVDEGNMPHALLLPIKLSNPTSSAIKFDVSDETDTSDGAASKTFDADEVGSGDYSLLNGGTGTVTIQAGQTEAHVVVLVNGDYIHEKSEWAKFKVTPNADTKAYLASDAAKTGTLMMSNDDKAPDLEINNVTGKEGETVTVTGYVTGVADSDIELTVVFNGGASDGKKAADQYDFENPGATPKKILSGALEGVNIEVAKVKLLEDQWAEPAETIRVTGYGSGNKGTVTEGVITIAANGSEKPDVPAEGAEPSLKAIWSKLDGVGKAEVEGYTSPFTDVKLWGAEVGDKDWKELKSRKSDEHGYFWFDHGIDTGFRFVAEANGKKSDEVTVWVTEKPYFVVSTSSKGQLNFGVKGNPWWEGQTAAVQEWTKSGWKTIRSGKIGKDGVYRASYGYRSGSKVTVRGWVEGNAGKGIYPAFSAQQTATVK